MHPVINQRRLAQERKKSLELIYKIHDKLALCSLKKQTALSWFSTPSCSEAVLAVSLLDEQF